MREGLGCSVSEVLTVGSLSSSSISGELIGNAGSQALPQTAESETQDWSSNLCPKEPSGGF